MTALLLTLPRLNSSLTREEHALMAAAEKIGAVVREVVNLKIWWHAKEQR